MQDEVSDVLKEFRSGRAESLDAAFETLFRMHQRAVFGWTLRIVRNTAVAEELTVETFWRIYQAHARFDPRQGFEGWARTIATRVALDWMRRQREESELGADVAAPGSGDPGVTEEIRRKTAQAFGRLPPKLRVAAVLAVVEEMPHKEVAAALGISTAAVKVRVFRALRLLRRDLEQQGIKP
ncbi:MAG: sigma-70 family RNA polymerase sigma factor [Terracidiphilus sp.]|nr:sigma-70 family RNA polymerase sigma factor [Terracidiphilus sp.]